MKISLFADSDLVHWSPIMMGLKFIITVLCATLFFTSAMAQDDIPSYETTSGSATSASPDNTGPEQSILFDLLLNADNPNANTFSTVTTPVTVTFTITDQPYNVSQDTDEDGDASVTDDNPATVLGWNFTADPSSDGDATYNGDVRSVLQTLDAFSQSVPASINFTSLKSVAFLSADPNGDGINADGTTPSEANYGANISTSYEGLRGASFDLRHDLGTLTVTFSKPVDDPVLHFNGLGGRWFYVIDPDGPDNNFFPRTRYYNTATTDLDFEAGSSTSGIGTPEVLSGTSNFVFDDTDSDGTFAIRNNSDNPDANSNENSTATSLTFAVAHGSVLFPGQDITTIVFTMRARFMTARDVLDTGASDTGASPPYDETIYGDTDGLGWAGNTGTTESQSGNEVPDINFSNDVFVVSASIPAPNSTDLTGDACFRMLSSPVTGTTYATLLDAIWTQGRTGADYTGGDPNTWLWPTNVNDADSDASDWTVTSFSLNDPIPSGLGFLVSVYDDDNYDASGGTGFPKVLTLEGGENNPPISPAMNSTTDGWTLLGNPFKSTIDWDNVTNSGVFDAIYVYDRNAGGYRTYGTDEPGLGFGDVTNGLIAPFQGFFVQNNGSGSVTFDEGAKSSIAGTFYGKDQERHNFARFEVNGEELYNSMWIRFSNNGAAERALGDALELQPLANEYAMLGTRKTDGTIFDIGHYPIPDDEFEIPVILETTRAGYFTITATDFDISFGSDLYFIDLHEQESIRIDKNFSYSFSTEGVAKTPGGDQFNRCSVNSPQKAKTFAASDRFVISTQPRDFTEVPASVALNQNYPNPFNPTTQISYDLPQTADVRLEVYDLVGRQVATLVNQTMETGAHTVNFDAGNLSSGVYIYRLNAGNTVLSRKLTVIK